MDAATVMAVLAYALGALGPKDVYWPRQLSHSRRWGVQAATALIEATGYERRLGEFAALRACLAAHILAPDRDEQNRPIWYNLIESYQPAANLY